MKVINISKICIPLTYEYVKDFVEKNSLCKLLSNEYKNNSTKMEFLCECGNVFSTTFGKFKDRNKRQCNKCGRKKTSEKRKLTYEYVYNYIKENSNCELLSKEYKNEITKMDFKCGCGRNFKTNFINFKFQNKRQCNKCGQEKANNFKRKYTYEYVENLLNDNGCKLLSSKISNYINKTKKIKVLCFCGEEFETTIEMMMTYNKFQCNTCGYANAKSSLGEKRVEEVLKKYKIDYKSQYLLKNCVYKNSLRSDFSIFLNNKIYGVIEFDGEQHYKPVKFWGGEKTFNAIKKRDKIKNNYCIKNNIKLLRIPYYNYKNIESIIKKYFSEIIKSR